MADLPRHVAIIMDGNGRWAKKRGLPRVAGHRAGAKAVRKVIEHSRRKGIKILTLFAFSTENWRRPIKEVNALMQLLLKHLQSEVKELNENGVRLHFVGDINNLRQDIQDEVFAAEQLTSKNKDLILNIALNYSGCWDIVTAAKTIAIKVKNLELTPEEIDEEMFRKFLCFADCPEPDLLIRTSGEQRISNFMLWQLAYSELYFIDVLWPDFTEKFLDEALEVYAKRQRRFGGV